MRRLGLVAALLMLLGVLAACQFTVIFTQPSSAIPVAANTSSTTPVDSINIAAGATVYYDVSLDTTVRSYDALFVMLDPGTGGPDLNLGVLDYNSDAVLASSSSPNWFADGRIGLSALSQASTVSGAGVRPQAVSVGMTCLSSCIIWPNSGATHYYVGIQNQTSSAATVDLYAYGFNYDDSTEPQNNQMNTSTPVLASGSSDSGAIETLNDSDFWSIQASGNVTMTANNPSLYNMEAAVYSGGAQVAGPFKSGTSFYVNGGEYVRVYSANGYAGASSPSGYSIVH